MAEGRSLVEQKIEEIKSLKSEQGIRDIIIGCELEPLSKKEYRKLIEEGKKRLNELDWGT